MTARSRVIVALLIGCVFGCATLMMLLGLHNSSIRLPLWLFNLSAALLIPGFFAGYAVSGNIHVANPWMAALANFAFYFAVAYFVLTMWGKLRAKSRRLPRIPLQRSDS